MQPEDSAGSAPTPSQPPTDQVAQARDKLADEETLQAAAREAARANKLDEAEVARAIRQQINDLPDPNDVKAPEGATLGQAGYTEIWVTLARQCQLLAKEVDLHILAAKKEQLPNASNWVGHHNIATAWAEKHPDAAGLISLLAMYLTNCAATVQTMPKPPQDGGGDTPPADEPQAPPQDAQDAPQSDEPAQATTEPEPEPATSQGD